MEVNLIQLLGSEFGGDVVSKLSGTLDESEGGVQKAVGGLGPVLVGAMAEKASSSEGLTDVLGMLTSGGFDGSKGLNLGSLAGDKDALTKAATSGAPQVVGLLGDRRGGVTEWLASSAGIEPRSAASLLSLAAPMLLNLVGGQAAKSGGLNPAGLGQLLGGQGAFLQNAVPADLASALGISDLSKLAAPAAAAAAVTESVAPAAQKLKGAPAPAPAAQKLKGAPAAAPQTLKGAPAAEPKSGGNWWIWVIIILVVIAIVAYFVFTSSPPA